MKTCPYCAEEIQDEAIVCRYCRRDLGPYKATPITQRLPSDYASRLNASEQRQQIWRKAWKTGAILAVVYAIYFLTQSVQGRVDPNVAVTELIFGCLAVFIVGTVLDSIIKYLAAIRKV